MTLVDVLAALGAVQEELTEALEALSEDEPAFWYVSAAIDKISAAADDLDVLAGLA